MINEIVPYVCSELEKISLDYMLSGSAAVGFYSPSRNSNDIDVIINIKEEDIEKFISTFGERFFIQPETVRQEIKRKGMFNIIDTRSSFKIDFILKKNSEYREHEFSKRKKVQYLGTDLWIVSLEDLILSKFIWIQELESEMQKRDIAGLLRNNSVDYDYLQTWISKLHLNTYKLL
jgi:hypothetical protein